MYNVHETPEYNAGLAHGDKVAKHIAPKLEAIKFAYLRVYVSVAYNAKRAGKYLLGIKDGLNSNPPRNVDIS